MSGKALKPPSENSKQEITILLVDDIPETRENIKKLLAFEQDLKVVGAAGTGREGVEMAREFQPDIIIMDINMPDMDGLQATTMINKLVPTAAVIIMSVQNDADYMRRAMLAGARDFLTKPINMDELYNTIRTVYKNHEAVRRQYAAMEHMPHESLRSESIAVEDERAGHIIVVYSPQGGVGTTTIATNLASALMKENVKVLLVDADLQFADVATFLNLQTQTTIAELAEDVDDLDVELVDNIVATHESGLKVLIGPERPENAEDLRSNPAVTATIVEKIASNYDFIVVDTANMLDEVTLNLFDRATRILLVGTPTLVAIKNVRFVLELFSRLEYESQRTMLVLNHVYDDRKGKTGTFSVEKIEGYLKRPVVAAIPHVDERITLNAINKGVPIIAIERDSNKPPTKQLLELADFVYHQLMGGQEDVTEALLTEADARKKTGIAGFLGR